MKTSARNTIPCVVADIVNGAVNAEVHLKMANGRTLTAIITNSSAQALGLKPNTAVTALVKASSPILVAGENAPRTSARNCLSGTVASIAEGVVNSEITLDIGGISIVAIVTKESVAALDLTVGAPVSALIKASHVILAVDD